MLREHLISKRARPFVSTSSKIDRSTGGHGLPCAVQGRRNRMKSAFVAYVNEACTRSNGAVQFVRRRSFGSTSRRR